MKKMVKIRFFTEITLETFGNCMTIPLKMFCKNSVFEKKKKIPQLIIINFVVLPSNCQQSDVLRFLR